MTPMTAPGIRRAEAEDGAAVLGLVAMVAATLVVALVVVVDVGAYLWAASRAQSAADGAVIAAVVADGDPKQAAREVAVLSGGDLVTCECGRGAGRARVVVRVPVGGLVLHRIWATSVDAEAAATSRREVRR